MRDRLHKNRWILVDDEAQGHLKRCSAKDCNLCRIFLFVHKHRPQLSVSREAALNPQLPAHTRAAAQQCWLQVNKDHSVVRMGCIVCNAEGAGGPWASFNTGYDASCRINHLMRHTASRAHKAAVLRYLKINGREGAPATAEFLAVWDAAANGLRPAKGVEQVGKRERIQKLQWCLAEAMRAADREFLKQASVIALIRDERHGRLLIRYRAVDANLNFRCGVLGLLKDFGTGAVNIAKATLEVMQAMMTPGFGCPSTCGATGRPFPFPQPLLPLHTMKNRSLKLCAGPGRAGPGRAGGGGLCGQRRLGGRRRPAERAVACRSRLRHPNPPLDRKGFNFQRTFDDE
jgi:hypothetical protein